MTTFIIVLHVVVSLALIFIILLQAGTGAGMGAAFGAGSSQTLFGSSGSSKFFTRLTAVAAAVFMLTSLSLTVVSAHRVKGTVMEGFDAAQPVQSEQVQPVTSQAGEQQNAAPSPAAQPAGVEQPENTPK
ncbi:MAG: preprotein translocase subunit SecG [Deltaproteobacteria bacterium]|nr:preprotein translocase subunit SecG [Candidatus Anaeroferrophillus wilburensis]MBN2888104.1 preprotein translocase subunit SecG [Deltaproteobacteria bacterium]